MPRSPQDNPDYLLATENYAALNERFYEASPHEYFDQRLGLLLLAAGKPEEVEKLLQGGISFGQLGLRATQDEAQHATESPETKQRKRERFITAEAEVLLHHASEALLRLYLAHEPVIGADGPPAIHPCPWLQIARLR